MTVSDKDVVDKIVTDMIVADMNVADMIVWPRFNAYTVLNAGIDCFCHASTGTRRGKDDIG